MVEYIEWVVSFNRDEGGYIKYISRRWELLDPDYNALLYANVLFDSCVKELQKKERTNKRQ